MTRIEVFTSGIWQTTSTIIEHDGACLVIDPAYFPRELDAIVARVGELGRAEAVVFTHGHWDHVMGHAALPDAPVWLNATLEQSIASGDPRAAKYLEDAREFDSRWYVPRDGYRWPERRRGLVDETIDFGGASIRVLPLPGHSPDDLGLVVEGTLLVGDYLSPCEIPFVDDADAYRATLKRLLEVLGDVREVVPGHGPRMDAARAQKIAREDLVYLDQLALAAAEPGIDVRLPRATDVVGMRDHHTENLAKIRRRVASPRHIDG